MDRTKKDMWIKLEATTNLSTFHSASIKPFSRSFAEFVALHTALAANHPQVIVPALPIPATSAAMEDEEDRLLKIAFQKWVDRVCKTTDLARDEELRSFLEANFGVCPLFLLHFPLSGTLSVGKTVFTRYNKEAIKAEFLHH